MNKGFTLVELLVSISIFTVITTMAVYNHSQFNGSVLLTNLAYEVGLSIHQAQFYGISVRQNAATAFDSGYGIHFDPASPTSYILFEDKAGGVSHARDAGDLDLQVFAISKGNKINKVCVNGTCGQLAVDITFLRPNPDAYFTQGGSGSLIGGKVDVCVKSPQGTARRVTVESTGQISIGNDGPPAICD